MKKDKSFYGWLFAVVALSILLGLSIYLGVTGWYFQTDFSVSSDIELGSTVEVAVHRNQANTASFSFNGGYLQGEALPQIISVKNDDESGDVFLRAKVYVFTTGNESIRMELRETVNWVLREDGYYYFKDKLTAQGKVGICSHVVISPDSEFRGDRSYIMTILFESLDATLDPELYWGFKPGVNL